MIPVAKWDGQWILSLKQREALASAYESASVDASEKAEYRFKAELERAVREGAIELWSWSCLSERKDPPRWKLILKARRKRVYM